MDGLTLRKKHMATPQMCLPPSNIYTCRNARVKGGHGSFRTVYCNEPETKPNRTEPNRTEPNRTDLRRTGNGARALERGEPLLLGDGLHHLGALAALLGGGLHQPSRARESALHGVHQVSVRVARNRHLSDARRLQYIYVYIFGGGLDTR